LKKAPNTITGGRERLGLAGEIVNVNGKRLWLFPLKQPALMQDVATRGRLAPLLAALKEKKVGPAFDRLNVDKVRQILRMIDSGKAEQLTADRVGVSRATVRHVIANRERILRQITA
jgi:hypothetical protein